MFQKMLETVTVAGMISLFLAACAGSPKVFSDFDPRHDFTRDKTFTWVHLPPLLRAGDYPLSALAEESMTEAIKAEFNAKGYNFVERKEDADLAVVFTMGARDKIEVIRYPVSYYRHRYDWGWGAHYFPYFIHYPFHRDHVYMEELRTYTDSMIALDVFSTKTNKPIWHTTLSERTSSRKLDDRGRNATEIAINLLQHFPLIGCEPVVSKECRPFNINEQNRPKSYERKTNP